MRPIGVHGGKVMCFESFRADLGFHNCDDICMCVVNKQLSSSRLFLIPFMLTWSIMRFILLLLMCACVVLLGMSVRLSWYPVWWLQ